MIVAQYPWGDLIVKGDDLVAKAVIAFSESVMAYHGDLVAYVGSQLPRQVADKVAITINADPYLLRSKAQFKDDKGRVHECQLEEETFGNRRLACRIPEEFVAHLCAVV
jgi:hypothetical protein